MKCRDAHCCCRRLFRSSVVQLAVVLLLLSLLVKMECTALHTHFDAVHSSYDFGLPKEDPEFWRRLQEVEHFSSPRTLLVDDSIPVLESARRFGIGQLVAIRRPEIDGPTREVEGFEQVDSVVELIEP